MPNLNLVLRFDDQSGRLYTDDEELNKIIRATEQESGTIMSAVTPAVTFDDDPDNKIYLLLLMMYNSSDNNDEYTYKEWVVKTGRQSTYDYLKDLIKNDAMDPSESFVIAGSSEHDNVMGKDNVSFESNAITVFRFMKVMRDTHKVLDNGEDFDIDEYDPGFEYSGGDKSILEI